MFAMIKGAIWKVFFILLLLSILQEKSPAQWILQGGLIDEQVHRGIELTYNMDYAQADRTFDSVIAENPSHPSGYFYKAMVNFWRAVTNTDNTGYDEPYREQLNLCIERADKLLDTNDLDLAGLFYKGAALGMRARIFAIRPNWQDAVGLLLGDAKEGVKYLNKLEDKLPGNGDIIFGRGLYNYYVEAVKEDNPGLAPVIGFFATGNKRVGLEMLEYAAKNATYSKTEAMYELMKINYIYEKNYTHSYDFARILASKYPNNSAFLHYLGFCQVSLNLTQQYDSTYRVILARSREKREGYTIKQAREAMYFIGQAFLLNHNGNLDSALYYLYNCNQLSYKLTPTEVTWWIAKSELLMGEAYDARGNRKEALMMYDRVMKMTDVSGAHGDAQRYIDSPFRR
jgi:tetratricopeptide (TPR) repeat protein